MRQPVPSIAVCALTVAALALPGAPTTGDMLVAVAQSGTGNTQLVLQSVDVDLAGIIDPESWTAAQGSARFAPSYGSADFSFPIPSVIPPQGAPVTLSVTVNATTVGFGPALGIHGDASFVGPSTQAGAFAPAGQSATGSTTLTIVPRAASPGTSVLIYIGLLSGPRVDYRFRAEAAGCSRAAERADLISFQASACPPPKCAGVAATIVGDPDATGPIFGTPGRDVIVGTDERDLILGRGGNDLICGRGGNDTINGNAGSDTVNGEGGDDRIQGGDGASTDRLGGQAGRDEIIAGPGDDLLVGGTGLDTLKGGPGDDRADGGPGADALTGGPGDDLLLGGPDDDALEGDSGADALRGGAGSDVLSGDSGDDLLFGDAGEDFLYGARGNDSLEAGPRDEQDRLAGDSGVDRCVGAARVFDCERLR